MTAYLWAMLLLGGAVGFIVLEMFVPSGGLLAMLATTSLATSIGFVYYYRGFTEGTIYLGIMALLIPVGITSALKWWPYTPIGRRILNVDPDGQEEHVENPYRHLEGHQGVAVTNMLLSGSVRVDGHVYDAVSDGQAIDAGAPIEVVDVEGNRIMVRVVDRADVPQPPEDTDILSRPASEIIADSFEDPLA